MDFGLDDKDIDSLREKCMLLRKKLKDSVLKISEYASMCGCYDGEFSKGEGSLVGLSEESSELEDK